MRTVSVASDLFDFSLHFISFLVISLIPLLFLLPDIVNFLDVVDKYPAEDLGTLAENDSSAESEGSLPPSHDSFPDAGEARNDFWSMSGNFIYRHHVEPRVKLYSPREESLPIPLKYIDVSRTHTNLDVKHQ